VPKRKGSVVIPARAFAATAPSGDAQSRTPRLPSTWAHENQTLTELIPASVIRPASLSSNPRWGTTPIVKDGRTAPLSPAALGARTTTATSAASPSLIRPAGIPPAGTPNGLRSCSRGAPCGFRRNVVGISPMCEDR
jgi:hypothetical protein